jgi:hypothetical protein
MTSSCPRPSAPRAPRTPAPISRLMTEIAVESRLPHLMARHTRAHRDVPFLRHRDTLGHIPVTIRARRVRGQVHPMAVTDIRGNPIHPDPGHRLALLRKLRELLNRRTVLLDRAVALHADGRRGDGHGLARVGVRMTHLALQLEGGGVLLMTERDRLRRRVRRPQHPGREKQKGAPHTFPARICSARYSEARMESERIVMVGFCDPPVTKLLPSTTKRFFTSWL